MDSRLIAQLFQRAWEWRERGGGALDPRTTGYRVFHGPGEGSEQARFWSIDRLGDVYWITERETTESLSGRSDFLSQAQSFYAARGAKGLVFFSRQKHKTEEVGRPDWVWGELPQHPWEVQEGPARFWVHAQTRHSGLFLDQAPQREFLRRASQGSRVLNAFCYTGSLSVAAAQGGATSVVSLDLARPALEWAQQNFELNGLLPAQREVVQADVFQALRRFAKQGRKFDGMIFDPPSFSRSKTHLFSVEKDLERLCWEALPLLTEGGWFLLSMNAEKVSSSQLFKSLDQAVRAHRRKAQCVREVSLPESFPTALYAQERYLKGGVFRIF